MVPPPRNLPGFPDAVRVKPKTARPGGGLRMRWKDASGAIYEWDYQHGHVEKYDARGSHLGGYDPVTGWRIARADGTRRVEP
ncbi:colicin E3/pyocin S6 family cytotoxin [Methylobacterium sp. J-072]|uniref:colicin E3/pyocin S6 family cytotoxin n=1 Tax=Methylobacterium sp. J-072 TaxID=2836651 RepID=UPI00391C7E14